MINTIRRTIFTVLALLLTFTLHAGPKEIRHRGIIVGYGDSPHKGRVHSVYAENTTTDNVTLFFINEHDYAHKTPVVINGGAKLKGSVIDLTFNALEIQFPGEKRAKEIFRCSSPLAKTENTQDTLEKVTKDKIPAKKEEQKEDKQKPSEANSPHEVAKADSVPEKETPVDKDEAEVKIDKKVIDAFNKYLEKKVPFYALSKISEDSTTVQDHISNLKNWNDREAYIQSKELNKLVELMKKELTQFEQRDSTLIVDFFKEYKKVQNSERSVYADSMKVILEKRRSVRSQYLQDLQQAMEGQLEANEEQIAIKVDKKMVIVGTVLLLLLVALIVWYRHVRRRQKTKTTTHASRYFSNSDDSDAIVVRNTTSTVLRKQNLDDVVDNDDYLKIDCSEFCTDSAVRYMYFKNSCIRDIYHMYAEDLRNPENPKEDGCMVLGRWVHDEKTGEYDVSLEQIVLPGDDAKFEEYELNFGGKIKLKMSEKLRKLRRETNLQYDLTCWVHSHPGLGVFFSNYDNNVHMQLKNPMHPNFLTAIVVDILTPEQDFGIFTFRSDSTINSKSDLTKMYSLEAMYKWAVGSLRTSFKAEDHFNIMAQAKAHPAECNSVQLSNGSVIDMGLLTAEPGNGMVALAHGFSQQHDDKTIFVVTKVDKSEMVPDNELIGCFVVAAYCSIPSIRKTIASYLDKAHFVLVYTTSDGLLTSIPVINRDLCEDEDSYGEQKLEDLKIWTRRKR